MIAVSDSVLGIAIGLSLMAGFIFGMWVALHDERRSTK